MSEAEMNELSHVDESGRASMVDIGGKPVQRRVAVAKGKISLAPRTVELVRGKLVKKGDVLALAEFAGIQAAKRTAELIPLCHPLPLDKVEVAATLEEDGVAVVARAMCTARTGIEMEALTAVSAALLTIYDMCKAADREMEIGGIALLRKEKHDIGNE